MEENLGEDGTKDSWRVECRLLNCTLLLLPPAISLKPVYAVDVLLDSTTLCHNILWKHMCSVESLYYKNDASGVTVNLSLRFYGSI